MNLRKQAEGKPCTFELPGCDGGGETTVLAHLSFKDGGSYYMRQGVRISGHKVPDEQAAWACGSCHDIIDRRAALPAGLIGQDDYYYYGGRAIARTAVLRARL